MLRISPGLAESGMGHCWLHFLVFLGSRRYHKDRFSSSLHPLEKVNFSRDEHMLGWLARFSQMLLERRRCDTSQCEISWSVELVVRSYDGGGGSYITYRLWWKLGESACSCLLCPGFNLHHFILTVLLFSSITCYFICLTLENFIPVKRIWAWL